MRPKPELIQRSLPALGASTSSIIIFIAVLSIILTAGQKMGLSTDELTSWIMVLYGLPGLLSLVLAIRYRQPLILVGNIFAVIFFASLGDQIGYAELVGATILAGAIVAILGLLGLINRLAAWIPAPIVMGLLAGAILPYVIGVFTALGDETVIVGSALAAYILGRGFFGNRIPAILPALIAGFALTGIIGKFGALPADLTAPVPAITPPAFSLHAIFTVTPVVVVLMTLQGNVPSMIVMRKQGFHPPEKTVNVVSGGGAIAGSVLGPVALTMAVLLMPLVAGPDAGEFSRRHRSVYVSSGALILIGALAGAAAVLSELVPLPLLLALAGLALFGAFTDSVQQMIQGPLLIGPLFTFAISLSQFSLFGFGPFFWAIVLGMGISLLLERDELKALRT